MKTGRHFCVISRGSCSSCECHTRSKVTSHFTAFISASILGRHRRLSRSTKVQALPVACWSKLFQVSKSRNFLKIRLARRLLIGVRILCCILVEIRFCFNWLLNIYSGSCNDDLGWTTLACDRYHFSVSVPHKLRPGEGQCSATDVHCFACCKTLFLGVHTHHRRLCKEHAKVYVYHKRVDFSCAARSSSFKFKLSLCTQSGKANDSISRTFCE